MKIGASLADVDPMQLDSSVSYTTLNCMLEHTYCLLQFSFKVK